MKKQYIILLALVVLSGLAPAYQSKAETLASRLKGRILLQVESHGEAWYVRPKDLKRYYMKDGVAAYSIMRFFSLGITDANLAKIPQVSNTNEMKAASSVCASNSLGNRLRGEILLQVEKHGEAWYVDPVKCRAIYMKNGQAAYGIMRFLGLGITNADLSLMPAGTLPTVTPAPVVVPPVAVTPAPIVVPPVAVTPAPIVVPPVAVTPAPVVVPPVAVTPAPVVAPPVAVTPAPVVAPPITPTISQVNKRAVVIVYKNVYDALKPDIDNFQNDVFAGLGVKIDIIQLQDSLSYTPIDIRNLLITECQPDGINGCANLGGAVLVGDIPYAWYAQPYDSGHQAPFMYFYEDLDASFKQNDVAHSYGYEGSGAYYGYDDYGAHGGPEIYTGWIPSTFPSTDFNNYINELRAYFQKHHNFFTKQSVPAKWAVSAVHVPYAAGTNHYLSIPNLGLTVYGTENSIDITPDIADNLDPFKPALLAELSKGPEVAYLHSHGSSTVVWGLTASDFSNLTNLPLFMLTWGCANGNFIENVKDSIVLAFIHGKNLGLSILSKLDSNDMDVYSGNCPSCSSFGNIQVNFFRNYNKGQYVGEAWLNVEHDFAAYKDPSGQSVGDLDLYKLSGPLQRIITGSPFIYSPTARDMLTR